MFATILLIVIMSVTGILMNLQIEHEITLFNNMDQLRFIHRQLSTLFSFSLLIMTTTGLIMYFYPIIKQRKIKQANKL